MTLVIKANIDMTNPAPDVQFLPDLSTGLLARWRAADLAQSNGSAVLDWTATGLAGQGFRHLTKQGDASGLGNPTYRSSDGPNGNPSVRFSDMNRLLNSANDQIFSGPKTFAFLIKLNSVFSSQGAWPIIGGESGFHFRVEKSSQNFWMARASDQATFGVSSIPFSAGWEMVVITLEQINSTTTRAEFTRGEDVSAVAIAGLFSGIRRFSLGALYQSSQPTNTFQGDIAEIFIYDRLLSNNDKSALLDLLNQTYGL